MSGKRVISFRIDESILQRASACKKALSKAANGVEISRNTALRICVERGLIEIERQLEKTPNLLVVPADSAPDRRSGT